METVHQLRVSMPDIEPVVWRRIHVASDTPLSGLHAVIQVAMGWDDAHLWELSAQWERHGPNEQPAEAYTVAEALPAVGSGAGYVYDFGDQWIHHITVEEIHHPAANIRYPRCSAGCRACPPEDCGGPLGYERTLRAIRSRKGPRYRELREWACTNTIRRTSTATRSTAAWLTRNLLATPTPPRGSGRSSTSPAAGTQAHPPPVNPLTTRRPNRKRTRGSPIPPPKRSRR